MAKIKSKDNYEKKVRDYIKNHELSILKERIKTLPKKEQEIYNKIISKVKHND